MTFYDDTVLADTPLLYWKLAADANDSSGNSRHGSVSGGTWNFGQASGIGGTAGLGNGSTAPGSAFIGTASSFALPAGTFTIEMWADLALTSATMLWGFSSSNFDCWMNGSNLQLNNGGSTVNPTAGYATTGRHHLVWVITQGSATSAAILYLDGVAYPYSAGFTVATFGTTNLKISGWYNDTGYRLPAGTYVSHFAVYSGALSSTRVGMHYNAAQGPWLTDAFAGDRNAITGTTTASQILSTSSFTTEASEPLGNGPAANTGWGTITPATSATYQFDTIGSTFDTALALYSGSSIGALTLLKADDSSGGSGNALIRWYLRAGTTYYIQAGGTSGGGSMTFTAGPTGYVLNDEFGAGGNLGLGTLQSTMANPTPTTFLNMTNGATEAIITNCNIQAVPSGTVTVSWDLNASMSQGGAGKQITYRLRRDNLSGTVLASIVKNATVDSTAGADSGFTWTSSYSDTTPTSGRYVMTIQATSTATSTMYMAKAAFSVAGGAVSTTGYTTETSEPLTMPVAVTGWARFVPTISGTYQVDTIGSAFDTGLAIYTGTSIAALTLVASDNNSGASNTSKITTHLNAGTEYAVQVGSGSGTAAGTVLLTTALTNYDASLAVAGIAAAVSPVTGWLVKGRSTKAQDALPGG